jgi:hypothetical protein
MMENGLEVLDKLLDDRLHDDAVVILGVGGDHDGGLGVGAERGDEAPLQRVPDLVGQVENGRLFNMKKLNSLYCIIH